MINIRIHNLIAKISHRLNVLRSHWLSTLFLKCPRSVYFEKIGLLRATDHISIGDHCRFHDYIYLTVWGENKQDVVISIGKNCNFGAFNNITGTEIRTGKIDRMRNHSQSGFLLIFHLFQNLFKHIQIQFIYLP